MTAKHFHYRTEMRLCQCGCNQYFMAEFKTRPPDYFNVEHHRWALAKRKREQRQRAKEQQLSDDEQESSCRSMVNSPPPYRHIEQTFNSSNFVSSRRFTLISQSPSSDPPRSLEYLIVDGLYRVSEGLAQNVARLLKG